MRKPRPRTRFPRQCGAESGFEQFSSKVCTHLFTALVPGLRESSKERMKREITKEKLKYV